MDNLVLRGVPLAHLEKMRPNIEQREPADGARSPSEINASLKHIQDVEADLLNLSTLPAVSSDESKEFWMDALAMSETDWSYWGVWAGVLLFVSGTTLWYVKVQRPADLIARNQAMTHK
jgi:hypothetical protein